MPAHAILNRASAANVAQLVALVFVLVSGVARAEPITLKLASFTSDQVEAYQYGVKPFVDAINTAGKGLLAIKVYPNGALGRRVAEQPAMLLKGTADIAWVVPGQTPYRFPDNVALEMPGLFRDLREGTLVYTRLIAAKALRGYRDFVVIGAYTSAPSIIHSRKPIGSLAALKGQKIRTNNAMEAEALSDLGAIPTIMPAPQLANAIAKGAVDGAIMSPTGLFQFGAAVDAKNHYLLGIGSAPLLVLMSRAKFDSLPPAARALIRQYSGEWTAATWIKSFGSEEAHFLARIKSDPQRHAVEPPPSDRRAAQAIYRELMGNWAAKSAHNRTLMEMIKADIATIRSAQ